MKKTEELHFYNFSLNRQRFKFLTACLRFSKGKIPLLLLSTDEWQVTRHLKYAICNKLKGSCQSISFEEWNDMLIDAIESNRRFDEFCDQMEEYLIINNIEELKKRESGQLFFFAFLEKRKRKNRHTLLISEETCINMEQWMTPSLMEYLKDNKIVE